MALQHVTARHILTPARGCLAEWATSGGEQGVTHTLNPFVGCPIGRTMCGAACYAQHFLPWRCTGHRPEDWGKAFYVKRGGPELYVKDIVAIQREGTVGIFMSSVTEPMPPQRSAREVSRAILEAMVKQPPARGLIIQSHTAYAASPEIVEQLVRLNQRTGLLVSISIETDQEHIRGLRRPCSSVEDRLGAFSVLAEHGILTQASVSPILPGSPERLASLLRASGVWRVILDHWEIGDGSGGARTESVGFPELLRANGYDARWFRASILDELQPVFEAKGFPGGVGRKEQYFAAIPRHGLAARHYASN